jgi:hypothetical protein
VAALFYALAKEWRFCQEAVRNAQGLAAQTPLTLDHPGLWAPTREREDYSISQVVVVFGGAAQIYGGGILGGPLGGCVVESLQVKVSSFAFDDTAFCNC